ncbi:PREDICTED: peroxisomal membrane protein PEX14-like [Amphimedon queenslandica]|uniref:Peroxisomal membrane protein PEX14 n=1 Tax=Amphimedon queenslandica TaxID=400682 RepID=A0A1X7V7K5_AMPQE|nr:PREDICTED: peroxisomal membrane protein PEX14-like [Amphimedon queenslandica]|eukprot:XP_003385343.1 PREDICTED: peroxisomal membrane protein PEX14-like [Amphimedon queenslandica]
MAAMSSESTSAASSPEVNGASTDPIKGSFVPRDSSYSEFMRRLLPERQKLLDIAVKFLINPRVVNSNDDDKIAFLNKKGLNEEEIYWVRQEAASRPAPSLAVPAPPTSLALTTPTQATPTLTHLVIRGVLVGSMFGIFIYWIKGVVSKWFDSLKVQQERHQVLEERVQEIRTTLETTMQELQQTTLSIKVLLERQQEQITQLSSTQSNVVASNELRTINSELSTLKGLLLNRHQFPTPQKDNLSLPPGIPSWQRNTSLPPLNTTNGSSKEQEEASGDGGGGGGESSTGTTVQQNSNNDNNDEEDDD